MTHGTLTASSGSGPAAGGFQPGAANQHSGRSPTGVPSVTSTARSSSPRSTASVSRAERSIRTRTSASGRTSRTASVSAGAAALGRGRAGQAAGRGVGRPACGRAADGDLRAGGARVRRHSCSLRGSCPCWTSTRWPKSPLPACCRTRGPSSGTGARTSRRLAVDGVPAVPPGPHRRRDGRRSRRAPGRVRCRGAARLMIADCYAKLATHRAALRPGPTQPWAPGRGSWAALRVGGKAARNCAGSARLRACRA